MYPAKFHYHRSETLADAVGLLNSLPYDTKILAGGQTLIPLLKLRLVNPKHIVDIGAVRGECAVENDGRVLSIGALARHADIASANAVDAFPILRECAAGIADPQVRNMGTIGGSLAEADPCSDWPTLLCTLDAAVECLGPTGLRRISVRDLLREPFAPALEKGELIRSVKVATPPPGTFGAYVVFKRCAQAYPTASCAVTLRMDDDCCVDAHIGYGCMGLTPIVAERAVELLRGQRVTQDLIDAAARAAATSTSPVTDGKGTAEYKNALAVGIARRALRTTVARSRGAASQETHFYYGR